MASGCGHLEAEGQTSKGRGQVCVRGRGLAAAGCHKSSGLGSFAEPTQWTAGGPVLLGSPPVCPSAALAPHFSWYLTSPYSQFSVPLSSSLYVLCNQEPLTSQLSPASH